MFTSGRSHPEARGTCMGQPLVVVCAFEDFYASQNAEVPRMMPGRAGCLSDTQHLRIHADTCWWKCFKHYGGNVEKWCDMQAHHITSGKSINWRSSLVTSLIHHDHSPTARALGSSALGKVWGQNRFRTLYGFLGQIRFGLPKGFRGRFHTKVRQVSWCLWSSGADRSWASTRLGLKRFRGRLAKAPPRFHRGSTKVSSGIVKVLVQNDAFVFLVLCSKWLSPPKRYFGVFPKQFFTLVSQSCPVFWANGCCFIKGSVEGSPTVLYIYLPVSSCSQSWVNCWHGSLIQIQSTENDPSCCCCWGILWAYFCWKLGS